MAGPTRRVILNMHPHRHRTAAAAVAAEEARTTIMLRPVERQEAVVLTLHTAHKQVAEAMAAMTVAEDTVAVGMVAEGAGPAPEVVAMPVMGTAETPLAIAVDAVVMVEVEEVPVHMQQVGTMVEVMGVAAMVAMAVLRRPIMAGMDHTAVLKVVSTVPEGEAVDVDGTSLTYVMYIPDIPFEGSCTVHGLS